MGSNGFTILLLRHWNKYALKKAKHARSNQTPFMAKDLSKNIMKISQLRNKYLKTIMKENRKLYSKQRNYCVSLLRKTKKSYYKNLDERKSSDKKLYWKAVKPALSEIFNSREKINLIENGETVQTEKETAEVNFFDIIVKNLNISHYSDFDPIKRYV